MSIVELAALLLSCGAILSRFAVPPAAPWLLAGAAVGLAAGLFANPARWQLYPAAVGLLLFAFVLWQPQRFGTWSTIAAAVLLVVSAALAQVFAVPRLPAPSGPHRVGTVTYSLDRPADGGQRPLFLKIWYPASAAGDEPEGLWSDLPAMADVPWYMRWSLAYLGRAATHSHRSAPYAGGAGPVPVVLYNHSFVSWASENSLLAEDLASRGHVVVAVRHLGQVDEYRRLEAGLDEAARERGRALQAPVPRTTSREERARLSAQMADIGVASEIVRRRADDSRFVADRLGLVLEGIPGMTGEVPPTYAAVGFSLGGAVSTQLCVEDARCRAVANIDGGVPGVDYARLRVPHYLMVYGAANIGGSDRVRDGLASGYEERVFARAAHADFHDAAIALPVMRWFFGRTVEAVERDRRQVAEAVASFLERAG